MAKTINRLSAIKVNKINKAGWYADGAGLYLQVSKTGSKSWVYRYEIAGKERRHGLGRYSPTDNSLIDARIAAGECRKLRRQGIDPIEYKHQQNAAQRLKDAKAITFKECALAYIDTQKSGWKNPKHEMYWRNTLDTYAYPVIGELPVQQVDTGLVLKVIEPLWYTKTETASRVRQRIENILDWAKFRGYREGENPALWRGHLSIELPKRSKVKKVKHFPSMPYIEAPAYFQELRQVNTVAAKALAFTILTATRATEARECRWSEIDIKCRVWTIPPERMKGDEKHRIPLTDEALKILKEIDGYDDEFLFPGLKHGQSISEATVRKLLRKTHDGLTVHGFRSSFRDWCAEMTFYPREVAEAALAHSLSNATEAAYQRGDLFAKRSKLMEAWSNYCLTDNQASEVVPINKTAI